VMTSTGELDRRRRHRRSEELRQAILAELERRARELAGDARWSEVEAQVLDGTLDPRAAAARLLDN